MSGARLLGLASELFTANETEQGTGSAAMDMLVAIDPNLLLHRKNHFDQLLTIA